MTEIHEYMGSQIKTTDDLVKFLGDVHGSVRSGFGTFGGRVYTVKTDKLSLEGELSLQELMTFVRDQERVSNSEKERTGKDESEKFLEAWMFVDLLNKEGNAALEDSSLWAKFWTVIKQVFNFENKDKFIREKLEALTAKPPIYVIEEEEEESNSAASSPSATKTEVEKTAPSITPLSQTHRKTEAAELSTASPSNDVSSSEKLTSDKNVESLDPESNEKQLEALDDILTRLKDAERDPEDGL